MKRDIKLYLHDIRESILAIEDYIGALTEDDFYKSRQVQDAVLRRLEVIGEAVKNIDDHFRNRYPDIPWKKIAGMRDVVIHEYFGVSLKRVWNVVKKDLPDLKQKIFLMMENKEP
ncbi:MAG: hypothetical protein A2X87_01085 [Deltaproteobacteria bacterium GWC2_42_51]|nr:MAG: hypothetical protein A2056_03425 [Deltaproteobacteria bacterium GWA2_42_85]OGP34538.1 MAG: hypothetical protein A2X87_01085 [Deltaproteobacteria bacterium GWC2_42_51]OGP44069.1 MAG: hypothetical protein A2090_06125 [Deltaproteobacteria bacterium GWD2_42_10]OGP46723.1 MAG: hypothetical protein A2022_05360 [Deltaproteobacteria bacterium GWF2_42_12]OGQ26873.1 MAG: hypothetical protein A3D29_05940 [Deltaproteobacteria bacterium RIFCSPHIGHO2_02_FULL_42_44]OGQ38394.1 MAG: hypothetical protei